MKLEQFTIDHIIFAVCNGPISCPVFQALNSAANGDAKKVCTELNTCPLREALETYNNNYDKLAFALDVMECEDEHELLSIAKSMMKYAENKIVKEKMEAR